MLYWYDCRVGEFFIGFFMVIRFIGRELMDTWIAANASTVKPALWDFSSEHQDRVT